MILTTAQQCTDLGWSEYPSRPSSSPGFVQSTIRSRLLFSGTPPELRTKPLACSLVPSSRGYRSNSTATVRAGWGERGATGATRLAEWLCCCCVQRTWPLHMRVHVSTRKAIFVLDVKQSAYSFQLYVVYIAIYKQYMVSGQWEHVISCVWQTPGRYHVLSLTLCVPQRILLNVIKSDLWSDPTVTPHTRHMCPVCTDKASGQYCVL